jgi:hypothetical protein
MILVSLLIWVVSGFVGYLLLSLLFLPLAFVNSIQSSFSYVWHSCITHLSPGKTKRTPMSEVKELFRQCPACERRFHIRLVSKKLTDERREVEEVKKGRAGYGGVAAPLGYGASSPLVVEEGCSNHRGRKELPILLQMQVLRPRVV